MYVVKIVMFVWKDENKLKRGRGLPIFFKKKTMYNWCLQLVLLKRTDDCCSSAAEAQAAGDGKGENEH